MIRTVMEVSRKVDGIRAIAGDDESAHGAEDELHVEVLQAIADGVATDPRAMALAALRTRDISFSRWCA